MLDTYRRILVVPGARLFSAAGLVARLPISMVGLGIVLLVEEATGSYGAGRRGLGGLRGRRTPCSRSSRADCSTGSARPGCWCRVVAVFATAVVLLVVSVQADWPGASTYLFAAVGGAALPAAGSCVRARWSHALDGRPAELQTAFALEAVVDESVFILGPILVTVLATAIHPVAGLGTAVAAGLAGTLLLAAQRRTEPPAHAAPTGPGPQGRLPWRTLAPLSVVYAGTGGAVRRRRGRDGRVRGGAGQPGVRRAAAGALGARQPASPA